jgi:hypothetical protein
LQILTSKNGNLVLEELFGAMGFVSADPTLSSCSNPPQISVAGAGKTYLVYADLQVLVCWPHITPPSSFPNLPSLEIRASKNDVRSYVDAQIRMSTDLSKHVQRRPDLQEEIHSHISYVDGM